MGRPSEFTQDLADDLCDWIAEGFSLQKWCAMEEGRPHRTTVLRWLRSNEAFRTQYAQARSEQMEFYADQIIDISDNETGDAMRDRLRVDTRKWIMARLAPKKYGDKLDVTSDGDKLAGNTLHITREIIDGKKDE